MSRVLVELLYGKHAHTDALACVDVTAEVAARRLEGMPHSIAQLVGHMNYWMDYELHRISGSPVPYPEHAELSWPTEEAARVEAWRLEMERFGRLLGRLADLARGPAGDLARAIAPTDKTEAQHASSLEAVLWQTLVHNSYHLGQVVLMRRGIGAWPPAGGSDTW